MELYYTYLSEIDRKNLLFSSTEAAAPIVTRQAK